MQVFHKVEITNEHMADFVRRLIVNMRTEFVPVTFYVCCQ